MKRAWQFVARREWAMFISFVLATLTTIQVNAEILPDDVEGYVIGPAALGAGYVTRLKVWAEANLP